MGKKLNWGIITTGNIARSFTPDLLKSNTGRLVAVGARHLADARKFAADFGGATAHEGYEAVLADPAVEAVYIGTPHPWHAEWALKAAAAGKHILCEKPLTLRKADTKRVIAAAKKHQVLLMEAYMYRLHPQTRKLVELVRDGAIGELRLIRASFNVITDFKPGHRMFKKELGGGSILDLGCYPVSFSRHIAGAASGRVFVDPVEFHGTGHLHPRAHTDDFATAVARYPGDIVAELSCGSTYVDDNSAELHGTTGWIDVPNSFTPGAKGKTSRITLHRRGRKATKVFEFPIPGKGLYSFEADAVAAAVARGDHEVPEAPWADSLGVATMLDQWLASVGMRYD